jgi:hypothetical protein
MDKYMTLFQVLLGGLLSFAGGYGATWLTESSRERRDARNLALAFRGELVAINAIAHRRQYLKGIAETMVTIARTKQTLTLSIHARREYFHVYKRNVDKLGTLRAPLPGKIATFYTQASSVLEDFESLREGEFDSSWELQLSAYKELHALLESTTDLAVEIISDIEKLYPKGI